MSCGLIYFILFILSVEIYILKHNWKHLSKITNNLDLLLLIFKVFPKGNINVFLNAVPA